MGAKIIYAILIIVFSFILAYNNNIIVYPYGNAKDVISPSKTITINDIEKTNEGILIKDNSIKYVMFSDTNSMDPVIDKESIGLLKKVNTKNNIKEGDIIVFRVYVDNKLINIVHRVVSIKEDELGRYFITKGDNLKHKDNFKVREEQILGKIIGILY